MLAMPNRRKVVISISDYLSLVRSERVLNALIAGGVDNWEWYDASLESLEEPSDEEILKEVEYAS